MRAWTLALLLAGLALFASCRAHVRDPACLAIYDDCVRGCQSPAPAGMPDQTDVPLDQQCATDCHLRARSCESRLER